MTRIRVLITRPVHAAERTARKIAALGHDPVVVPLRAIEPSTIKTPEASFDLIAVTSGNAVAALPDELVDRFAMTPVACVGSRTATAARAAGFANVCEGGGTASALAATIVAKGIRTVLYLCGTPRRCDLETALVAVGLDVHAIETYQMVDAPLAEDDRKRLIEGRWDIALLYSAESAGTLRDGLGDWHPGQWASKRFLCLSQAVADRLPVHAPREIAVEPREDALLALLG